MDKDSNIRLMSETVQLSLEHAKKGGLPFSSMIIDKDGQILGRGVNEVTKHSDPTAHAEIMAIRDACNKLGSTDLSGTTLLASGEPCALCYTAARLAGISTILMAADRHEIAAAGFDYRWTYQLFGTGETCAGINAQKLTVANAMQPFEVSG